MCKWQDYCISYNNISWNFEKKKKRLGAKQHSQISFARCSSIRAGLFSLSGGLSHCKLPSGIEAAILCFEIIISLCNPTGDLTACQLHNTEFNSSQCTDLYGRCPLVKPVKNRHNFMSTCSSNRIILRYFENNGSGNYNITHRTVWSWGEACCVVSSGAVLRALLASQKRALCWQYVDKQCLLQFSYKITQLDICGGNLWATMLIDHPLNLTLWRKQSLLLTDIFPLSQVYRLAGLAVVGLGVGVGVEVPNMFIYFYVFCYMDLFRESRTSNVSFMKFPAAKLGCY